MTKKETKGIAGKWQRYSPMMPLTLVGYFHVTIVTNWPFFIGCWYPAGRILLIENTRTILSLVLPWYQIIHIWRKTKAPVTVDYSPRGRIWSHKRAIVLPNCQGEDLIRYLCFKIGRARYAGAREHFVGTLEGRTKHRAQLFKPRRQEGFNAFVRANSVFSHLQPGQFMIYRFPYEFRLYLKAT